MVAEGAEDANAPGAAGQHMQNCWATLAALSDCLNSEKETTFLRFSPTSRVLPSFLREILLEARRPPCRPC